MTSTRSRIAALALAASAAFAAAGLGPDHTMGVLPPNSSAHGRTLAGWLENYWVWYQGGGNTATEPYQPGTSPFVFMPLPQDAYQSGSGTSTDPAIITGSLEVNLAAGQSFILPIFGWIWERYNTGQPDDPSIPEQFIRSTVVGVDGTGAPEVTIDGRPLRDFWSYYPGAQTFDPILTYANPTSYGSIAALRFQSAGFLSTPLTPGRHTIHIAVRLSITNAQDPQYAFPLDLGIVYDNTWTITVR